jgi:Mn2+/Fe2+ NRAMP family transporter
MNNKKYVILYAIKLLILILIAQIAELTNMNALLDLTQMGAGVYIAICSYTLLSLMKKNKNYER